MNYQEIFDKVASHLLKQNARSMHNTIGCAYRGENGMKCAVGVLIKDEYYSPDLEGCRVETRTVLDALKASGVDVSDYSLLHALQRIHDLYEVETWRHHLLNVAKNYNLNIQALNEN